MSCFQIHPFQLCEDCNAYIWKLLIGLLNNTLSLPKIVVEHKYNVSLYANSGGTP
jgi:hypothetical protein